MNRNLAKFLFVLVSFLEAAASGGMALLLLVLLYPSLHERISGAILFLGFAVLAFAMYFAVKLALKTVDQALSDIAKGKR